MSLDMCEKSRPCFSLLSGGADALMADYVDYMRELSDRSLAALFRGVSEIYLTDLPDHPNVGDSAIALGEFSFLRRHGVEVRGGYSVGTVSTLNLHDEVPVLIHGGGNIGGLYPQYDTHRDHLHRVLSKDRLVIQAPQTVDFLSGASRANFFSGIGSRSNFRIALRDDESASAVSDIPGATMKAPDAFHSYGRVVCGDPTSSYLIISRTDGERVDVPAIASADWPPDRAALAFATRVRKHSERIPGLSYAVNPTPKGWERIASARFYRGAHLIEQAETIVTDRLHAMLMALQMGRRVIAIDNATRKLSRYAQTWFGPAQPDLEFATSFDEGLRRAR